MQGKRQGKVGNGKMVSPGPKLRVEMPEMDAATPMVSLLDSFQELRMSTAGSTSEPTAEQLLRDYNSLAGVSRERTNASSRSKASVRSSPLRDATPASVSLRTSRTVDPAWEKTLRQGSQESPSSSRPISSKHEERVAERFLPTPEPGVTCFCNLQPVQIAHACAFDRSWKKGRRVRGHAADGR